MKVLSILAITVACSATALQASGTKGPGKFAAKKVSELRTANQNYLNCRKNAITQFKQKKLDKAGLNSALAACKSSFPEISHYLDCKKQLIVKLKKKDQKPSPADFERCRALLAQTIFDTNRPFPFVRNATNQLAFAGAELTAVAKLSEAPPAGFDCTALRTAVNAPLKDAQFFMFGSGIDNFPALKAIPKDTLKKKFRPVKEATAPEWLAPKLGKIYGADPTSPEANLYFPLASCSFTADRGVYNGLDLYYLIDYREALAKPYFATAFYKADPGVRLTILNLQLKKWFPQRQQSTASKRIWFYSGARLTDFDREGDPRNLCRTPRREAQIAVLKGRDDNAALADYLLLANLTNLCEYGDLMTARFAGSIN